MNVKSKISSLIKANFIKKIEQGFTYRILLGT